MQAEYWHDPLNEHEYREKSVFLADINQEKVGLIKKHNSLVLKKHTAYLFVDECQLTWTYILLESQKIC